MATLISLLVLNILLAIVTATMSLLLMPINANIGNLSYVLCAIIGTLLETFGSGSMTIGTIIAFLGLNKNFT